MSWHKQSIDPRSDFPQVQLPSVRGPRDQQGPSWPGWVGVCTTGLLRSHGAVPLGLHLVSPRSSPGFCLSPWAPALTLGFAHALALFCFLGSLCFNTLCLASKPWFVFVPRLTSCIHSVEAWPPTLQERIGSHQEPCYPNGLQSQLWCWGPALPASRLLLDGVPPGLLRCSQLLTASKTG